MQILQKVIAVVVLLACYTTTAQPYQEWLTSTEHPMTFDVYGHDEPYDSITTGGVEATASLAVHRPVPYSTQMLQTTTPYQVQSHFPYFSLHRSLYHPLINQRYQYRVPVSIPVQATDQTSLTSHYYKSSNKNKNDDDAAAWRLLRHNAGEQYAGEWFSQENKGYSRKFPYLIYGIKCSGHFCDDKQPLYVLPLQKAPLHTSVTFWTPFTSKNSEYNGRKNTVHCPRGMFVLQMQCKGISCSKIRLGCSYLRQGFRARYTLRSYEKKGEKLNEFFSDENGGEGYCPDGEYLDGIECSGWFCDNIRLYCTRVQISNKY